MPTTVTPSTVTSARVQTVYAVVSSARCTVHEVTVDATRVRAQVYS